MHLFLLLQNQKVLKKVAAMRKEPISTVHSQRSPSHTRWYEQPKREGFPLKPPESPSFQSMSLRSPSPNKNTQKQKKSLRQLLTCKGREEEREEVHIHTKTAPEAMRSSVALYRK